MSEYALDGAENTEIAEAYRAVRAYARLGRRSCDYAPNIPFTVEHTRDVLLADGFAVILTWVSNQPYLEISW